MHGLQWGNPEFREAVTRTLYILFTGMQPLYMVTNGFVVVIAMETWNLFCRIRSELASVEEQCTISTS